MPEFLSEDDLQPEGPEHLSEADLQPEGADAGKVLDFRAQHLEQNPERSARVLRASIITGVPSDLVDADLDSVEKAADHQVGINRQQLASRNPGLANAMAADPHVQAAAEPDAPHLEKLGFLSTLKEALWPAKQPTLEEIRGQIHEQAEYLQEPAVQLLNSLGLSPLTMLGSPDYERFKRQFAAPVIGAAQRDVTAGLETAASANPLHPGDPYSRAFATAVGGEAFGLASEHMQRWLMSKLPFFGEHAFDSMNPRDRQMVLEGMQATYGKWGTWGLDQVMGLLPMMGMGGLGAAEAGGELAEGVSAAKGLSPVASKLTAWAGKTVGSMFEGSLFGVAQSATTPGLSPQEGAASGALFAGALHQVFAGLGAGFGGIGKLYQSLTGGGAETSMLRNAILAQELDAAGLMKLRESSPETAEHLMKAGGTAGTVGIPIDRWNAYFQGAKLDPLQEAARIAEDGGEAFQKALANGGDVQVPVSKLLKNVAGTPHAEGLIEDMRVNGGLSARDISQAQEAIKTQLEQAQKAAGPEFEDEKKVIEQAMRDQAIAAGRPKAEANALGKLTAEFYGTQALKMGVSVGEAARAGNLHKLRILGSDGAASPLATSALQQIARITSAPESTRFLTERAEGMSPETRARETYIDRNTGLLNERAFADLPADPEKPLVGHISVEGIKYLNDQVSHEHADLLYRAVGKALHDIDPQAAKVGGDFAIRVKDKAELDQALEQVRAALPEGAKDLQVTGDVGDTFEAAGAAHGKVKAAAEIAGTRAKRGERPLGFAGTPEELQLPKAKAFAEVPEDLQQRIAGMGTKEYVQGAYVEPKTGLLTRQGWEALPKKAHAASIDLKGLRAINDEYGNEFGDAMLERFGDLARILGGSSYDFTHLHGDEYAAQHNDPEVLGAFLAKLKERVKDVGVAGESDGKPVLLSPDFRHEIGESYEAADRELSAKKQREKLGTRGAAEAGADQPGGSQGEGIQAAGDLDRGNLGAESRREALGPGGAPQGFGSIEEARRLEGRAGPERGVEEGLRAAGKTVLRQEPIGHLEGLPVTLKIENVDGKPRGLISFETDPETGRPVQFDIHLLETADKSTALHEMAHFFSYSLHELVQHAAAPEQLRADYDNLLKWAGYESPEAREAEQLERAGIATKGEGANLEDRARAKEIAAKEEKISHGFEAYLLEGRAPGKRLARVFSKFREWLTTIYRGISGISGQYEATFGKPLQLSPDVRGIFDRLLGQEDAIRATQATLANPEENPLAMARMTPEERKAYRAKVADAKAAAEQGVAAEESSERLKAIETDRERFTDDVATELDRQPVYRAWRYLEKGTLPPEFAKEMPKDVFHALYGDGHLKINRSDFVDNFGEDAAARMPPNSLKKGGVPIDELAPLLGFDSGTQLYDALTKATPRDAAISGEVQKRLDAKYGPEQDRRLQAALSSVHNDADLEVAVMEHRALSKELNPAAAARAQAINPDVLRPDIRRMVGERYVDQLDPKEYARAERQYALEAAKKLGAGDEEGAADARVKRLINKLLFMETRDARAELEAGRDKISNPSRTVRENLGKADPAYRDVHDQVLAAAQLGEAPPEGGKTLDEMLEVAKGAAQDMAFDVGAIRKLLAQPKDFDTSMPVDEARNVIAAVENIRRAAKAQLEVRSIDAAATRAEYAQSLVDKLQERPSLKLGGEQRDNESPLRKARLFGQAFDASLTDPRTFAEMADAGETGPWHKLLVDSRVAARDRAVELTKQFLEPLKKAWDELPKKTKALIDKPVNLENLPPLEGYDDNRTRATLWRIFLQWGEEGNRQRLLDGRKWDRRAVETALQQLTPEEADFLQKTLDQVNGLYGPMADVHERETGLRPEKLQAVPITINGKEYAGGYFPAKYDSRSSRTGARQLAEDAKSVQDVFSDTYYRPSISASFAKERADRVEAPIDLSWSVLQAHVSQVIHDISYREYVKDAAKLLLDDDVKGALKQHLGVEREKQFIPWLQSVANQQADSVAAHLSTQGKLMGLVRGAYATQAVGWSLRSAAGVMSDSLNAVVSGDLSPVALGKALLKTWNPVSFSEAYENALSLSSEMRFREQQNHNNLSRSLAEFGAPNGIFGKIGDTAFAFHEFVDKRTATSVFTGKFNQSIAEGMTPGDAARAANDLVAKVLPSLDIGEKPSILRDKRGLAALLFFHGYANKVYNINRRAFDSMYLSLTGEDSTGLDKAKACAKFGGTLLASSVVHGLIASFLAGRGPEEDEDPADWALRSVLLAPLHTVPFVGPLADSAWQGKKPELRLPPELGFVQARIDKLWDLATKAEDTGDENPLWHAVEMLSGINNQAHSTVDYINKLSTGEAQPRGPGDVLGGLFYGERKKKAANPFTAAQDLLQ